MVTVYTFTLPELKSFVEYSNTFNDNSSIEEQYTMWLKWKQLNDSDLDIKIDKWT